MTLYRCKHCGNIIAHIKDSGARCECCGEEMEALVPNTADAAGEKHVPIISVEGNLVTVSVGSAVHPMLESHYIEWIVIETAEGRQRKTLKPGEEPKAVFALMDGDTVTAAYAYCNLHGLWKAEV